MRIQLGNWMGVGGNVMDANGKPLIFQTVQVSGSLNGKPVNVWC